VNLFDAVGQEEYRVLQNECDVLAKEEGIHLVFLIHSTGQIIVSSGKSTHSDLTSLAALFAGSMASASGISKIFSEPEFSTLIFEGQKEQIFVSLVSPKGILIIHFDKARALGWVRFMVKKRLHIISAQLESLVDKYAQIKSPMSDISEEEIDNLDFGGF